LPLFLSVAVMAIILTSCAFYFIARRIDLCGVRLIVIISAFNLLFCALFPLVFALLSGVDLRGEPALGHVRVLAVMLALLAVYEIMIVWRAALHSPSINLNVPVPAPDAREMAPAEADDSLIAPDFGAETPAFAENAYAGGGFEAGFDKKPVDSVKNLDKMGMTIEFHEDSKAIEINLLIDSAFDCLNGGRLEEAAEYFYNAIEKHPSLGLEIMIAIQLSMIYSELGHADLSLDILTHYKDKYRDQLSGEDMASIEAGIGIIEAVVAGIGGDGYETN